MTIKKKFDKREKEKISKMLKKRLKQLIAIFNRGQNLKLLYHPSDKRISPWGNQVLGELQNDTIIIYQTDYSGVLDILYHEYIEYIIKTEMEKLVLVINKQKEIIDRLLYMGCEDTVNTLSRGVQQLMGNDLSFDKGWSL